MYGFIFVMLRECVDERVMFFPEGLVISPLCGGWWLVRCHNYLSHQDFTPSLDYQYKYYQPISLLLLLYYYYYYYYY